MAGRPQRKAAREAADRAMLTAAVLNQPSNPNSGFGVGGGLVSLVAGTCGAKMMGGDRKGQPCISPPLPGQKRCGNHGGRHPYAHEKENRIKAEEAAREQIMKLGFPEPVHISHIEAMVWLVSAKYAEVRWLRAKVQELEDTELIWGQTGERKTTLNDHAAEMEELGLPMISHTVTVTDYTARTNIWWLMLRTAEDQLVRFAAAAHSAGVADAEVDLAKQRGQMLGVFLDNLMAALCAALVAAGVTREDFPQQWAASIADLFPKHFRTLGSVPA